MNFFEHQERARRNTLLLVAYFLVAVILIVVAVNLSFFIVLNVSNQLPPGQSWWGSSVSNGLTVVIVVLVLGRSFLKYLELRGGGQAVAEMVGARAIAFATGDVRERQLMNVTEEMAIASGVAPPRLYVMDGEPGINAFVAGLRPTEVVLVVTSGALEQLNREELQAVVGHEFSHVLNGDTRLNVRLIALLSGILAIGQLGSFFLRVGSHSRSGTGSSRSKGSLSGTLLVTGLLLYVVGYVGLFFGRLIKAAISRQRELLADASSVQFTRNPSAMASALLRIRDLSESSFWRNRHAEDLSHMCFGSTLRLTSWFATHPPLEERIAAVDSTAMARHRARKHRQRQQAERQASESPVPEGIDQRDIPIPFTASAVAMIPAVLTQQVGVVQPEQVSYAHRLLAQVPPGVQQALESAAGAEVLVCVLFAREMDEGNADLSRLRSMVEGESVRFDALRAELKGLSPAFHLPLFELTWPRLLSLPTERRRELVRQLNVIARSDGRLSVFEFVLLVLMRHQLLSGAGKAIRHRSLESVKDAVAVVLVLVLRQSLPDNELPKAYERLMRSSYRDYPAQPVADYAMAYRALEELAALSPLLKKAVLDLCADAVLYDGRVRVSELELLRAISAVLEVPMPPVPEAAA